VSQLRTSVSIAVIAVFSSLIAVLTIINVPVPPPLYEITFAPPVYMALSLLSDRWTAFSATSIGSFIGEAYNVAIRGGSPIFPLGIVWARGPEALIISKARNKGPKTMALYMALGTIYETLAFFFPDWAFYYYGLFQYGSPMSLWDSFITASYDFGTLIDLVYIPVALAIIKFAWPAFKRLGF
jgi:hypothetical protein